MPRYRILSQGQPDSLTFPTTIIADALKEIDCELVLQPYHNKETFLEAAQDVDGVLQSGINMFRDVVEAFSDRIRLVGSGGIGVDFVDVDAATERGIIVYNLPGVFEREVAHQAMALLLSLARNVVPLDKGMRTTPPTRNVGDIHHLYGETLGLVSFGNIARAMSKLANAFEFRVLAFDPFVPQDLADEYGVTMVDKDTLFKESDFISCHAPLTSGTHHLIGEQEFRHMKPSAYFINTGRGPVVKESALIQALQEGWIAGAGLDVLEQEPPTPDNPLLKMDHVVLSPHIASTSIRGNVERRRKTAQQLTTILSGKWPEDGLVNPAVKPLAAKRWGMPEE